MLKKKSQVRSAISARLLALRYIHGLKIDGGERERGSPVAVISIHTHNIQKVSHTTAVHSSSSMIEGARCRDPPLADQGFLAW